MSPYIYLDNSTVARPSDIVVSGAIPFFTQMWGTPTSPHQMGQKTLSAIGESLHSLYLLVDAPESDHFVFTSSGAEAINHTFLSTYFNISRATGKNHYLTVSTAEAPVLMSISRLEEMGCIGKLISPNAQGIVTLETIKEALTPRTAMVSLSYAHALTGVIQPLEEIAALCEERGVLLHLDITHALGKLLYSQAAIRAHFVTFNGEQLHSLQGTGGLFIRHEVSASSFILGGVEQAGRRAGSMNVAGSIALGIAAKELLEARDFIGTEIARLRDKLEEGILQDYPEAIIFFRNQERLPHSTAIGFPGILNEALLYALNRRNLFACIGGGSFQQIGLALKATGIPASLAHTAISFNLSRYTTEGEIDQAIAIIVESAHRLRKCSKEIINP